MRELSVCQSQRHEHLKRTHVIRSKAKKRCDQELPACGRCIRLGKACGGYRDVSDLIFKNETANVTRRASSQSEASHSGAASSYVTRQPSPEKETRAKQFFFRQFVTPSKLSFLEGISPDEFLMKPILACALAAMANRANDPQGREEARRYYVEAITGTNVALRHPRRVKEDNTLVSVCLLSIYEVRYNAEDLRSWIMGVVFSRSKTNREMHQRMGLNVFQGTLVCP